jgi:hypothetical protein
MHTSRLSFSFPGACYLFLGCFFFFWGVLKAERDQLYNAMLSGTAPTDPQDSQQGFNPLTGGTGSWVTTARPKPWREIGQFGLEAQLAQSQAACCGAEQGQLHAIVPSLCVWVMVHGMVCYGRRRQTSNFQRLGGQDPGDSRQCLKFGALLSSHVPVRPHARQAIGGAVGSG